MGDPAVGVAALEERVALLTHVVKEMIGIMRRLNTETYEAERTDFERVPPQPRVAGYPRTEEELKGFEDTLNAWLTEWDAKDGK